MKKDVALLLTFAIAFGSTTVLHAEGLSDESRISALEAKIVELENRISQLELLVLNNDDQNEAFVSTPFNMASGVYVGGEDIPVGDYSFKVLTGQGEFYIYSSYDDYANDNSGFDYKTIYMLMDETTRNTFVTQGFETVAAPYATELGNIKITDGLCISVEGVTLEGTRK